MLSVALRARLMPGCALHAPAGAAAIQAVLLKNPPGRIAGSAEHINLDPVWEKNVPIFLPKGSGSEDG